ncbi:MAG: general stress protein CsbD [Myxococcales bacterium 68-20]|nr:CsbD family protein [Myxococcales bacterium]OJY27672.1 MAG: general stress protein CsbD [Myxococcales bacterium 68-20]
MGTVAERGKGMAEQVGGKIEQGVGKVVGSDKMQAEGKTAELKGEAREEAAKAAERTKATAQEAGGAIEKGVGTIVGSEKMQAEGAAKQETGEARHKANQ